MKSRFSDEIKRYFSNTSWLIGERIFRMAMGLCVGIYVARYLGPVDFGLLTFAVSFVGLFHTLSTLGIDSIIVRELVKSPEQTDTLLGTAILMKLGGVLLMWLFILAALPFTSSDAGTKTLVAIIAFAVLFQAFNVIDLNYQAQVRSKYVVHAQLVQVTLSSIARLLLIWWKASLVWFACTFLLDAVFLAGALLYLYKKNTGEVHRWTWDRSIAKGLLLDGWPLILTGMAISIYMKIDQVMIKEILGAREVGFYAAALKISEAWYFVPAAITTSIFPAILEAKKNDAIKYTNRMQSIYDGLIWLGLLVAIPTTFLSPHIIGLLYGQPYSDSAGILAIHIWSGVFVCYGVVKGKWEVAENMQKISMICTLTGMVFNVCANLVLIPRYSAIGAAYATLISQFASGIMVPSLIRKNRLAVKQFLYSFLLPGRIAVHALRKKPGNDA